MLKNKVSYLNVSASKFADDLMYLEIPPLYKSKALKEDLYYFMGYLVSRAFIEVRTPSWLVNETRDKLGDVSPINGYYPTDNDRGFYVDDSKWSFSLTLRIRNVEESSDLFDLISPAIDQDTLAKCGATMLYSERGHLNSLVIANTKFCLYLIRHGFRVGKYHAVEEIKRNIPTVYRRAFMTGVNS